jgi:hypothetical protein
MTYTSGSLIEAVDYNGFVANNAGANINATWGTVSSTQGYGQTPLSTVAATNSITATQWATLNNTISSAAAHQGTAITSRTSPSAGQTVSILSALNTDLTNIYTNRRNAAASGSQYTAWTGTSSKTTQTGSGNAAWTLTWTHTLTWASTSQFWAFWNAGGLAKVQFNKSSTGSGGDTVWNNFITNVVAGAVYIAGSTSQTIAGVAYTGTTKTGGSGTPTILRTDLGVAQLNNVNTAMYQQFDTIYPYYTAYVQVDARTDNTANPTALVLTTTWYQPAWWPGSNVSIAGGTGTTGITFGSAPAVVVTYLPPSTTYLSNTWGTPTVAASVA